MMGTVSFCAAEKGRIREFSSARGSIQPSPAVEFESGTEGMVWDGLRCIVLQG
jgi:hypothetical protein